MYIQHGLNVERTFNLFIECCLQTTKYSTLFLKCNQFVECCKNFINLISHKFIYKMFIFSIYQHDLCFFQQHSRFLYPGFLNSNYLLVEKKCFWKKLQHVKILKRIQICWLCESFMKFLKSKYNPFLVTFQGFYLQHQNQWKAWKKLHLVMCCKCILKKSFQLYIQVLIELKTQISIVIAI